MRELDSIEAALVRLMPVGLSEAGQNSIDEMLDDLMGEETPMQPVVKRSLKWIISIGGAGIAAAIGLMALPLSKPVVETIAAHHPEWELMGESGRVENMTDEGWISDPDGGTMEAVRFRVVEENTMRDQETGIVVRVSEPREELLLVPVSAF